MNRAFLIPVFILLAGCGGTERTAPAADPAVNKPAPVVTALSPPGTVENVPFNVQSNNESAFSINGNGFDHKAAVIANGARLKSAFGNPGWVTAEMPRALFAKPGVVTIKVVNSDGKESNSVDFKIAAAKGKK